MRIVYNNYHACKYCGELVQHIPPYMRIHSDIVEVKEILESEDPSVNFNQIRLDGDDKHNCQVVREEKGEIVGLGKHPKVLDICAYGPCQICHLWVMFKHLKQHYNRCWKRTNKETIKPSAKTLVLQ